MLVHAPQRMSNVSAVAVHTALVHAPSTEHLNHSVARSLCWRSRPQHAQRVLVRSANDRCLFVDSRKRKSEQRRALVWKGALASQIALNASP